MRKLSFAALAISLAATASAQFPGAAAPPEALKAGFEAITIDDAKEILSYLAGPECEGRGSGQPGFQKAADFVAARFKAAGLKPVGDNGTYFQYQTFTRSRMVAANTRLELLSSGEALSPSDLVLTQGSDMVDVMAVPVFVEYHGATSRLTDTAQMKGRIVILRGDVVNRRLLADLRRGEPAAILTVADKLTPASWNSRMGTTAPAGGAVSGTISSTAAELLMKETSPMQLAAANPGPSISFGRRNLRLRGKREVGTVKVPNVVGLLEGSDPVLKNEYIGIGGHLDHLGIQNGVVYPGADDDGSGSTAVLEIVKGMAANPKKPRRSILFMTFFGEEMGLLGSSFLTKNPPVPLDKMVAELQMDMVARNSYGPQNGDPTRNDIEADNRDTMRLVGSKRISTELDSTIQDVNKYIGFRFKYDAEDVYTRSDHYNFARLGIPIAFLFDGFTPDYHQPSDTVDKINFLKLTSAARLYYLTAHAIAERDLPPRKDVK